MSFFNSQIPICIRKKSAFAVPAMPGLWRIHWQVKNVTLFSSFYTQHDQACLLWGAIAAMIFTTAQFLPLDWTTQAIFASTSSLAGIISMIALTHYFASIERISWILYGWVMLMLVGIILTDLSLFLSWGSVLMQICPLWLGLSAIGYLFTGLGMRSRMILLMALVHLLAIGILPYAGIWQPLTTGFVISVSSFLLAELQWDSNGVCGYQAEYHHGLQEQSGQYAVVDQPAGIADLGQPQQYFPQPAAESV